MNRITAREALAGIAPHLHGARSELSYVQAVAQAGKGQPVFSAGMCAEDATVELERLRAIFDCDPNANWYLRTLPEDGLVAIRLADAGEVEKLGKHFDCTLPRTLTVENADNGTLYLVHLRPVAAPVFATDSNVTKGIDAQIVRSVPLPGDGAHSWKAHCAPGELCGAFLPRAFVLGLPKRRGESGLFVSNPQEHKPPHLNQWR